MCVTCGGSGIVCRREREVKTVVCPRSWEGERLVEVTEVVVDRLGGPDACPECAARAEAAYVAGFRERAA